MHPHSPPLSGAERCAPHLVPLAFALGVILAWPLVADAQGQPSAALPAALDARAAVPPLRHDSAFARYRGLGDTPVGSWRDANDTVTRIGGWRTYTREAHAPEPPAAAASVRPSSPLPVATPASAPTAGHGAHGHHGSTSPQGPRP